MEGVEGVARGLKSALWLLLGSFAQCKLLRNCVVVFVLSAHFNIVHVLGML